MKGFLVLIALCFMGAHAIPKPVIRHEPLRGRVGGGVIALLAPHACMVLVHRTNLNGTNTAALGGGSIISTRHVLTAAHLVQGDNIRYQVGYIVGTSSRRLVESTFRVIHEDYDNTNFQADIALIFLQGTATFPLPNVIAITEDAAIPPTAQLQTVVGFGFTAADSNGASSDPYAAQQNVAGTCEFENFNLTETHFCAIDDATTTWVCPGDNGAGAFVAGATAPENTLVGVASRILTGCASAQLTGYTAVGLFIEWIRNIAGLNVATFIANYNKLHNL